MNALGTASDEVLHLHLAAGDGCERADAWSEVVRRHGRDLVRYFRRSSVRVQLADAEDLLQETLTSAMEDIDAYDPEVGPLRAWLFRIAKHRFLDWLKFGSRKKRAGGVQLIDDDRRVIDGPPVEQRHDDRLDSADARSRLRELSADLNVVDRDLLETLMRSSLDPDQQRRIAACHGVPVKTIQVRQSRLLQRLRELLKDYAPFGRYGGAA